MAWTSKVSTSDGGKWLSISPSSGTTPTKPSVLVDITGLAAGSYSGEVSIIDPEEQATVVPVTLEVTAVLNVSPSALAFFAEAGGANPADQTLLVEDSQDGAVGWTGTVSTSDGGKWLVLSPSSGTTPTKPSVLVDIESLAAGSYTGQVSVAASGGSPTVVPVTLEVTAVLNVTPSALAFFAEAGGGNPADQTLLVEDSQEGAVAWTGMVSTSDGGKWLALSPSSGTTPTKPSVLVDIEGLAAGSYTGQVSVAASGGNPTAVAVTLEITAALNVSPSSLAFSAEAGGANPAEQALLVEDPNDGNVEWTATVSTSDGGKWLFISPSSGATPNKIAVMVDIEGLAAGSYMGEVSVSTSGNNPTVVPVTLDLSGDSVLKVSPSSLTFSAQVGGANPADQILLVLDSEGGAVSWTGTVSTSDAGKWLFISPSDGTTPNKIAVSVNIESLAAGSYTGEVSINPPDAEPVVVAVTARVSALIVVPGFLRFSAMVGAPAERKALEIASKGEPVEWTATVKLFSGSGWLSVSPTSGTAITEKSATLAVEVNYEALPGPGLFQAVVIVTDGGSGSTVEVPVAVSLSAASGRLLVNPPVFVFTVPSSAEGSLSRRLRVINQAEGILNWSISGKLPSWLTVSPSSGTANGGASEASEAILTANPAGLSAGVNQALLEVSAPGATNTPQLVTVTLHVVPPAAPAQADLTPQGFFFVAEQGGAQPAEQELTLSNAGGGTLTAEFVASTGSGGDWLSASPPNGSVSGDSFAAQVSVNQAGLAAGVYRGTITGTFSSGPPQVVEVLLIVTPPAAALRAQAVGPPRAAQCVPSGLQLLATTIGNGLSLPVSFPRVLTALVVNDCGSGVDNATLVASVEGLNIPLRSLGIGFYSGTWVPQSEAASVTLTFDALHPDFEKAQRSFTVATAAALGGVSLPSLFADGVVEGAGFTPRRPLSAGGIVSLFGQSFATENSFASQLPLERELAGVSVRIGGQDAPLYFVGPGQINAQVPLEVSTGDSVPVAVSVGGLLTAPQNYLIAPAQPGIFIAGDNAAILDVSFQLVTPQNPVRPGDIIQIFATGLGETDPEVATGEPAPPFSTVRNPVTVTIGEMEAAVAYQGLAPGFVGLYQVNAVVPEVSVPDPAVPLVITQDGIASNAVTIAVQ